MNTQTLTKLNISNNEIGDKGANDLADALKSNKVTVSLVIYLMSVFYST